MVAVSSSARFLFVGHTLNWMLARDTTLRSFIKTLCGSHCILMILTNLLSDLFIQNQKEDVVEAKMDLKSGTGSLSCRICGASYQMPIHHLHEPIDVFSEWLGTCTIDLQYLCYPA